MGRTTWLATLQDEGRTPGRTITPPGGGEHGRMRLPGALGREEGGRGGKGEKEAFTLPVRRRRNDASGLKVAGNTDLLRRCF